MIDSVAQQNQRGTQQYNQYTKYLLTRQLLLQKYNADKTADYRHQQQIQLYHPDLMGFQISVVEEIDARLAQAAQQYQKRARTLSQKTLSQAKDLEKMARSLRAAAERYRMLEQAAHTIFGF